MKSQNIKAAQLTVKRLPLPDLKPHPENPRKHPAKDSPEWTALRDSLDHSYFDPIVWNSRNGMLVAGHLRTKVLSDLGYLAADCVVVDFDEPTHKARMIAANRQTGEWDEAGLAALLKGLTGDETLPAIAGMTQEQLDGILAGIETPANDVDAEPQIEKADQLAEQWGVKTGQVWACGEHRIMCGDSTKKEDVERLMVRNLAKLIVTDPPYGVDYSGGTTERKKLEGDVSPSLYGPVLMMAYAHSDDACPLYLWHSDSKSAAVSAAVSAAKYERRCTIIWNKNQAQFGALGAQYKTKHEPCYYLFKKGRSPRWFGPTNEVTVWDIDRNRINENHPTEKPVDVMARPIQNSSEVGDIVLDFFSGSGATLIACEQTHRKCRAMEISPGYVAVALQRFKDATGKEPTLLS